MPSILQAGSDLACRGSGSAVGAPSLGPRFELGGGPMNRKIVGIPAWGESKRRIGLRVLSQALDRTSSVRIEIELHQVDTTHLWHVGHFAAATPIAYLLCDRPRAVLRSGPSAIPRACGSVLTIARGLRPARVRLANGVRHPLRARDGVEKETVKRPLRDFWSNAHCTNPWNRAPVVGRRHVHAVSVEPYCFRQARTGGIVVRHPHLNDGVWLIETRRLVLPNTAAHDRYRDQRGHVAIHEFTFESQN